MEPIDDLLAMAETAHGHLCAGQILGVRMAMLGCQRSGIDEPTAVTASASSPSSKSTAAPPMPSPSSPAAASASARSSSATGARWPQPSSISPAQSLRIAARESSKELARALHPEIENKNQQQMLAYRELSDANLFTEEWVRVPLPAKEFPGYRGDRLACAKCGEGINYDRFVERGGQRLCHACANPDERYYQPL